MIAEVAMERLQRRVEIVRVPEPADLHPDRKTQFHRRLSCIPGANRLAAAFRPARWYRSTTLYVQRSR